MLFCAKMVLINRDDQTIQRMEEDVDSARLLAHKEWEKKQKHHSRISKHTSKIKDSFMKKVDSAQNGNFGPLFIVIGVLGAVLTLMVIIVIYSKSGKSS